MTPKFTALARLRSRESTSSGVDPEDARGRGPVDVLALPERLDQTRVAGEVREQPQLDLAVVGRQEAPALLRDEGTSDLAALFRADRDVLEVGIARGQPTGGRARLVERRVDPTRLADSPRPGSVST